ncbi:MAG: choice-of-anchor Q domain-containing protein [Anaerolineae bacterium]
MGGGIFNENGTFDLIHCTVSNNNAVGGLVGSGGSGGTNGGGLGGGLFNYLGTVNYANSVIFGNTADATEEDCDNLIAFDPTSQDHNLVGAGTGCPATGMNDIVTADAKLGALADNGGDTYTHALLPGSPAVNKGLDPCVVLTDQRGIDRPQGVYCDIGAYEATPDLAVSVDVSNPNPNAGDLITYTVTIANSGALTATNVIVSDTLPDGLTFVGPVTIDPPQPGATVAVTGGDLPSLVSGMAVDAGATVSVTFVLLVDLYQENGTEIENVVLVISDEVITPETGGISITVQAPDLVLTKTATPDDPPVGTIVTYEIVVENQGMQNATNAVLSDTLDALLIPVGPLIQEGGGGMVTYYDGWLFASGLTITQGESITFTLWARVSYGPGEGTLRMDVPDGTVIPNTVQVSSTEVITPLTYTEDISVRAPTLVPVKSVSDDTPLKGQTITYTIVVENSGSSDASNVTISDAIPEGLTFVENSAMLESSGGTVVLPGGSAPLLAHSVPIASQESVTLTFAATVNDDVADGMVITNTAYVTSTEVAAPKMAESVLTVRYPILSLTKTASDPTPALGHVFEYEIVVANGGSADATNAIISDDLPEELTFVGPVTLEPLHPEATVAQSGDDLPTLVSALTLPAFESVTVTLPVSVNTDLEIGVVISNVATVTSTEVADLVGNEGDPTDITIQGTELVLTKTVSNEHPNPGDVITYTIVVENRGPVDATDAVISDTLSEDLAFIDHSVTITPAHPEATLAQTADDLPTLVSGLTISVGARITVVFQVSVNQGLTNGLSIFNVATIASTEVPIPEGNEEDPAEVIVDDVTIPYFPVGPQILIRPSGGEVVREVRPVFEWLDASDNGVVVSYTLSITGASDHSFVAFTTTFTPTEDLVNGNYFWTIVAYDSAGNASDPVPSETFTVRLTSDMYMPFVCRISGP